MVGMRNSNVSEKIKCQKIDNIFTDLPKIIAFKKIVKQNRLIIIKI